MLRVPFDVAAGHSRANGVAEPIIEAARLGPTFGSRASRPSTSFWGCKLVDARHVSGGQRGGRVHGHMGE